MKSGESVHQLPPVLMVKSCGFEADCGIFRKRTEIIIKIAVGSVFSTKLNNRLANLLISELNYVIKLFPLI